MPKQRVKTVSFDVCKKAPKSIGYHSNVSSTTAKNISYQCSKTSEVRSSTR